MLRNLESSSKPITIETVRRLLYCVLIGVGLLALYHLVDDISSSEQAQKRYETLSEEISDEDDPKDRVTELKSHNSDIFAWIKIPETHIDYPVMHTPEDPEYYLHRDVEGNDSDWGTPFLAGECREDSKNLIIYGHRMNDKTMFYDLTEYKSREFAESHDKIYLDTVFGRSCYSVWAVCYADINDPSFAYYLYSDLTDPARCAEYTEMVKAHAYYLRPVVMSGEFITLSTCSYHTEGGRFVVIGVKNQED